MKVVFFVCNFKIKAESKKVTIRKKFKNKRITLSVSVRGCRESRKIGRSEYLRLDVYMDKYIRYLKCCLLFMEICGKIQEGLL